MTGAAAVPIDARAVPTSGVGSTADGRGLTRKSFENKLSFDVAADARGFGVVVTSGAGVTATTGAGAGVVTSGVGCTKGGLTEDAVGAAAVPTGSGAKFSPASPAWSASMSSELLGAGAVVDAGGSGSAAAASATGAGADPIDARAAPTSGVGSTADGRGLARKSAENKLLFDMAAGVDVGGLKAAVTSGAISVGAAVVMGAGAMASGARACGAEDVGGDITVAIGSGAKFSLASPA